MECTRRIALTRTVAALGCLLVVGYGALPTTRDASIVHAAGAVHWQYKNATMASYSESDLYNSGPALQQLARTGANSVTFTVTWYTSNVYSTDIFRTGATASDASLVYAIQQAQSLGLLVMLKPHLDSQDGQWRAYINPSGADQWFTNYTAFLDHYADIGTQYHAVLLCVGAELISMSTNAAYESRWRALIAHERARFGGALTYSGNWGGPGFAEEFTRIPFWDALDYLGISAYFFLATTNTPTVASLNASWANYKANLVAPFQQRWGKPLLFTEGGYRSLDGAAQHPWDASSSGPSDQGEQADCYEALFETWGNVSWFAGAMFWFWSPNANADPNDTDYEVQNKAAYTTVSAWFASFSPTATPTRTPTATPTATPAPQPTVSSMTPTSGSTGGGTSVTISGGNFAPGVTVAFGGAPAVPAVGVTGTTMTVTTPTHVMGTVDVTVMNPGGRSATLTHAFTFVAPNAAPHAPGTILSSQSPAPRPVPHDSPPVFPGTPVPQPARH